MSSNYPPGVTESMIPGNTPADIVWESFWDNYHFFDALYEWSKEHNHMVHHLLDNMMGIASAMKCDGVAKDFCETYEDQLPIETWIEEYKEEGGR